MRHRMFALKWSLAVVLGCFAIPASHAAGAKTAPDPMRHAGIGVTVTPLSKNTSPGNMAQAFRGEFRRGPGLYRLSESAMARLLKSSTGNTKDRYLKAPLSFSDGSAVVITVDREARGIVLVEAR